MPIDLHDVNQAIISCKDEQDRGDGPSRSGITTIEATSCMYQALKGRTHSQTCSILNAKYHLFSDILPSIAEYNSPPCPVLSRHRKTKSRSWRLGVSQCFNPWENPRVMIPTADIGVGHILLNCCDPHRHLLLNGLCNRRHPLSMS